MRTGREGTGEIRAWVKYELPGFLEHDMLLLPQVFGTSHLELIVPERAPLLNKTEEHF